MADPIYLDYNATTPVDPAVVEAMLPYFTEHFGNPSSKRHQFGWAADEAVTQAREQVAALLKADPEDLIFTGGATEALNLAIKGTAARTTARHAITVKTEHSAVLEACRSLRTQGWTITEIGVRTNGTLDPDELEEALTEDTAFVAVMWANNETGVIHPLADISTLLEDHPAVFICDATQAVGKLPVSVKGIDLLACSAHKFYGPKGVGALYAPREHRLVPLAHGGSHERGLRSGTLNVPGIVGMGAAAARCSSRLDQDQAALRGLRDRFEAGMSTFFPDCVFNGKGTGRLPNTSSITIPGVKADRLLPLVPELAVSTGSACVTGRGTPSHVLAAMGVSRDASDRTLRVSVGRNTTQEQINQAVERLTESIKSLSPAVAG